MARYDYTVVNVFTRKGRNGNGLAVFADAEGLNAGRMQAIAKRLGFSETSFVFPAGKGADYRVRFFTPERELPFAGHPSIGTLYTLVRSGRLKKKRAYRQRIGRRVVELFIKDDVIYMDQGMPRFGRPVDMPLAANAVGLPVSDVIGRPYLVSTGLEHCLVPVSGYGALKRATADEAACYVLEESTGAAAVMPFAVYRGGLRCRMFAPTLGIKEDPATGSGAGPLAAFAIRYGYREPAGRITPVEIVQGPDAESGSLLMAEVRSTSAGTAGVRVGGHCRTVGVKSLRV